MARTFIRQASQVRNSVNYSDALELGAGLVSSAASLEDDLNALRSLIKELSGEANWYDELLGRNVAGLDSDLTDIEGKKLLFRTHVLADVAVPASQNYVVLAEGEVPAETSAGSFALGAIAASIVSTSAHSLAEVSGANAISPKNLCVVRDAATGQPVQSSNGKDVYALLQIIGYEGTAFDGTNAILSFVRENSTGDDLEACPAADIQGKTINYSYARRINLDAVPEDAFLGGAFVDQAGLADVTLDRALDNQGTEPVTQSTNAYWKIADTKAFKFQTGDGLVDMLALASDEAGNATAIDMTADALTVAAGDATFSGTDFTVSSTNAEITNGAVIGALDVSKTASGVISSASAISIEAGTNVEMVTTGGTATVSGSGNATLESTGNNVIVAAMVDIAMDAASLDADFTSTSHVTVTSGADVGSLNLGAAAATLSARDGITEALVGLVPGAAATLLMQASDNSILAFVSADKTGDLRVMASADVLMHDGNMPESWSNVDGIPFSGAQSDWTSFESMFGGGVSLLNAIVQAANKDARVKYVHAVESDVAADTDVSTGANYSGIGNFVSDVNVYLNGVLLRNGSNAGSNFDVYPGNSAGLGDLKFEFELKAGDVITVEVFSQGPASAP